MMARGIRGATTAEENTKESIIRNTRELLEEMMEANDLKKDDLACAFLTTTTDLNAEFPAVAARQMGWTDVALLCGHEMEVPGAMAKVVRVMLVANTEKSQREITHIYLKEAIRLRPEMKRPAAPKSARRAARSKRTH
jgi:chorismate mutase